MADDLKMTTKKCYPTVPQDSINICVMFIDVPSYHVISMNLCWFTPRYINLHPVSAPTSANSFHKPRRFTTSHSSHISMIPSSLAKESGYLVASAGFIIIIIVESMATSTLWYTFTYGKSPCFMGNLTISTGPFLIA